jgi:uncharacterized delta-60 repeat protein
MFALSTRRPRLTLIGAVAFVLATASSAAAPPGDLDTSFDGDGKVTTDFAGGIDSAGAVAMQGDGKIVTAGLAVVSGNFNFGLARYNIDGSLDTTFDGDGKVTTDFASGSDQAYAVAVQADGRIVVAGRATVSGNQDFALARYNSDGSLDTTFDGDGRVTTDFAGATDQGFAMAIQGDGRIVVAGPAVLPANDFALARYNTDGSLDTTFDGDGKVTTDFAGGTNIVYAVRIQGDGRIVAAGCSNCGFGGNDFALARYNTDGSLDTTFDGDGKVTTDFASGSDQAFGAIIQGDGRIVAAGSAVVSGPSDFALARYNTDGSLDTTFDADGKVTSDFAGSTDSAFAVALQGDGRLVTAGSAVISGFSDFALARYKTDGSLDTIFSGDGKVTTDFAGNTDEALAVAIQVNGRIVATGNVVLSGNFDFGLARYTCVRRTSRPMSIPLCP